MRALTASRLRRHPAPDPPRLRRDRYTLVAWWAGLGLFVAATTAMFADSLALHADLVPGDPDGGDERRACGCSGLTSGPDASAATCCTASSSPWRCWPR